MATQPERRERARARLLDAAVALISAGGFVDASVGEIGSDAGMSRGAVSHTFGSKAGLLAALLDECATVWAREGNGADLAAVPTSVSGFVDAHWGPWIAEPLNPRLLMMLIYEELGPSRELRPVFVALRTRFERYGEGQLIALQDRGQLAPEVEPLAAFRLIVHTLVGLLAQTTLDDALDIDASYATTRTFFDARWPPPPPAAA